MPAILTHGVHGLLAPLADYETLGSHVLRLLADPDRARALARDGFADLRRLHVAEGPGPVGARVSRRAAGAPVVHGRAAADPGTRSGRRQASPVSPVHQCRAVAMIGRRLAQIWRGWTAAEIAWRGTTAARTLLDRARAAGGRAAVVANRSAARRSRRYRSCRRSDAR